MKAPFNSATLWQWSLRLFSLTLFALGWEWTAGRLNNLLMPGATATLRALAELATSGELWDALRVSNEALLLGFASAALVGIPLGLWMGRWPAFERLADPYLSTLLVTPISALIPIFVMALGLGLPTRVIIVFTFAMVVIAVNTRAGARLVESGWLEMAQSFGASERQLWSKILLHGALPGIMTGLRLGLGRAITGMVTVELLLMALGVGRLIDDYQGQFEAAYVFAVVLAVVLEAVLLMEWVKWFERRFSAWRVQAVVE